SSSRSSPTLTEVLRRREQAMTTTQTTSAGYAGLMLAATIESPSSGWGVTRKAIDQDAALVERLRREDAGAVEALVRAYGDRVYRLAMRITGNASDAEEVVQDALWAASRRIDTFRGVAAFGSWIYRITANAAYQKLLARRSTRNEV